jgi:protein ImuA
MARSAVAQETVFALRETIARLEGKPLPTLAAAKAQDEDGAKRAPANVLETGIAVLDTALDGGLPSDGLTEIRSEGLRHAGAASGFALALCARFQARSGTEANDTGRAILWIADRMATLEAGRPYPLGLAHFGLAIDQLFHAAPAALEDALWLAEAALASGVFCMTILETHGNPKAFGLTESRRLNLRAKAARRPLLVLRHAAEEEASSALFRFLVQPAFASERRLPGGPVLGGSIGHPVFRLTLEKSRNPAPLCLHLEWNPHDRQFLVLDPSKHAVLPGQSAAHSGAPLSQAFDGSHSAPPLGSVLAFDRTFDRAS